MVLERPEVRVAGVSFILAAGLSFILGVRPVTEFLQDEDSVSYLQSVLSLPSWEILRGGLDFRFVVSLFVLTFPILAAVLVACAATGPVQTRILGAWGAAMVAAGAATVIRSLGAQVILDSSAYEGFIDNTLISFERGALFGFLTGWLFAGAVLLLGRGGPMPAEDVTALRDAPAAPPGPPPGAETTPGGPVVAPGA